MDIANLVKRQEELVADFTKQVSGKVDPAAAVTRPLELTEARAASVEARIAAIEDGKKAYIARADAQITALKAELKQVSETVAQGRKALQPALDAMKKTPTKGATGTASTKATTKTARKVTDTK